MKYTKKDYETTVITICQTIDKCKAINNPDTDTTDLFPKDFIINEHIINDLIGILAYTECFYKMNVINSKRLDDDIFSKQPFIEQLLNIILFFQDQNRILLKNYNDYKESDYHTGLELAVSKYSVEYNDNERTSILASNEISLECIDVLIRYLYYKKKDNLEERITYVDYSLVRPYENVDFKKYNILPYRGKLCIQLKKDLGMDIINFKVNLQQRIILKVIHFFENKETNMAKFLGAMRREAQFGQISSLNMIIPKVKEDLSTAFEIINNLADELISCQDKNVITFDFEVFHPDKCLFKEAENTSKAKQYIFKSLIKNTIWNVL